MNSKKEPLVASILAIGLAMGLGAISYSLLPGAPAAAKLESALDVYTQKGGLGRNVSDGSFEPFDNASIYAYLTKGGIKLGHCPVTLTIRRPDGTQIVRSALTNDRGIAETGIYVVPSEGHVVGMWYVLANATVDNEAVNDTLNFQCESQDAEIAVFSKRNGVPSLSFLLNESVLLEAHLSYRNASVAGAPVTFEIKTANGTEFLRQTAITSSVGTANITYRIPWSSNLSVGIWQISVTSEVYGQTLGATVNIECRLLPLVIDVFTQKGGRAQNMPGGDFALNETVVICAEVRDELNQTMPNQLVAFVIFKDPDRTGFAYSALMTNSSGIASMTVRIPPDPSFLGNYEVYARADYNDKVLLDTLTFIVREQ